MNGKTSRTKVAFELTLRYLLIGMFIGALFGMIEYWVRLKTEDDIQAFLPLMARAMAVGGGIFWSVMVFELKLADHFKQKSFLYLVSMRSIAYTFILTFWLFLVNIVWFMFNSGPILEQLSLYIIDEMYLINLVSALAAAFVIVGLYQVSKLHRKGELLNFILGKYHKPKEVERIFCFIDLKNSTTIAEKLGHVQFANFLRDYYSDITEALEMTKANIYQYVGDEITLSWSFESGFKHNRLIRCFFMMKSLIQNKKEDYLKKYGYYPEFKAGLHGGTVTVTWVGEIKKEIVFIGDVLNTTARICENCKRLEKNFLISEFLLDNIQDPYPIESTFVEMLVPRGKEEGINLYSLELDESKDV